MSLSIQSRINGTSRVNSVQDAVITILRDIGEDPNREGLMRTPSRVERMYQELTAGYHANVDLVINDAIFEVDYSEIVMVRDIDFVSLCEHHLLPFWGKVHVSYLPQGKVIGLSKIPRIVDVFAQRLQMQERLTIQIADALRDALQPAGVSVVIEGVHACTMLRGTRRPAARMITSSMQGVFRDDPRTRAETLALLHLEPTVS